MKTAAIRRSNQLWGILTSWSIIRSPEKVEFRSHEIRPHYQYSHSSSIIEKFIIFFFNFQAFSDDDVVKLLSKFKEEQEAGKLIPVYREKVKTTSICILRFLVVLKPVACFIFFKIQHLFFNNFLFSIYWSWQCSIPWT